MDLPNVISDADQARPLLAASDTVTVIVTSRNRLPGLVARDGVGRLGLDVLSEASLDALAVLLDVPTASARRVAGIPVAAHLAEPTARDRYRVHDLLRAYAVERARADPPPEEGTAAVSRGSATT